MVDLSKLKESQLFAYIFVVISLIIPGISYLYIVKRELFLTLDIVRLILICIFFSIPIFVLGFTSIISYLEKSGLDKKLSEKDFPLLSLTSYFSLGTTYIAILLWYLFKFINVNIPNFLINIYGIAVVGSVFLVIKGYIEKKNLKKKVTK